jgi:hypothetical protein
VKPPPFPNDKDRPNKKPSSDSTGPSLTVPNTFGGSDDFSDTSGPSGSSGSGGSSGSDSNESGYPGSSSQQGSGGDGLGYVDEDVSSFGGPPKPSKGAGDKKHGI